MVKIPLSYHFNGLVEKLNNDPGAVAILGRKKDKKINLNKARTFVDKMLHGKIDGIYTAEEEFLKEMKEDKDYLHQKSTTSERAEKIKNVLNELEHAVFGIDTPKEKVQKTQTVQRIINKKILILENHDH